MADEIRNESILDYRLENMMLLLKGMRLSIQPVTAKEFDIMVAMRNPRETFGKSLID
jgi:predicted RNA-binding protein with PUA-like domain